MPSQQATLYVIGAGYVGLVSAAVMASWGHRVHVIDQDSEKIASLQKGRVPFFEPGLQEYLQQALQEDRLTFSQTWQEGIQLCPQFNAVMVAVGTPADETGHPQLDDLWAAIRHAVPYLTKETIVVLKSTVPIGTCREISMYLEKVMGHTIPVVYNPEFLRQGSAVTDFLHPVRIVLGGSKRTALPMSSVEDLASQHPALDQVAMWYHSITCPVLQMGWESAELTKFAANTFLATKISFINWMAQLSEQVGADITDVAYAIGLDPRIGAAFLQAGIGFGGSCLPKDLAILRHQGLKNGLDIGLLDAVDSINDQQQKWPLKQMEKRWGSVEGKIVTIFGAAFKQGTTDTRASVGLFLADTLEHLGATVRVYDPKVEQPNVSQDPYESAVNADAIVIATGWESLRELDWSRLSSLMREPFLIDGRRLLADIDLSTTGIDYVTVGRGSGTNDR